MSAHLVGAGANEICLAYRLRPLRQSLCKKMMLTAMANVLDQSNAR